MSEAGQVTCYDAAGTGQWTEGDAFSGVQPSSCWSSSSHANAPSRAWDVSFSGGDAVCFDTTSSRYVWPVRGGL